MSGQYPQPRYLGTPDPIFSMLTGLADIARLLEKLDKKLFVIIKLLEKPESAFPDDSDG